MLPPLTWVEAARGLMSATPDSLEKQQASTAMRDTPMEEVQSHKAEAKTGRSDPYEVSS